MELKANGNRFKEYRKWEKVKPILSFSLEKSIDVAIAIMSLILQMNLGM